MTIKRQTKQDPTQGHTVDITGTLKAARMFVESEEETGRLIDCPDSYVYDGSLLGALDRAIAQAPKLKADRDALLEAAKLVLRDHSPVLCSNGGLKNIDALRAAILQAEA